MIYLALICSLASSPITTTLDAAEFVGTYQYIDTKAGTRAIEKAIETATEDLNFVMRPMVRGKLKEKNKAPTSFTIRQNGAKTVIQTPFRAWTTTLGAKPVEVTLPNDKVVLVSTSIQGQALVEIIQIQKTTRKHRFMLSPDGQKLKVQITIVTPKLPEPIDYELSYGRQRD